ncbi:MAG TPA: 4Fe-4S binding protein [Anaerolineae bacterium]|nr:4Fe-4S binding protein [Anaerolineae bacterium]
MSPRWLRRLRQISQVVVFLTFVALLARAVAHRPGALWADLFTRLDPLLMIAASLSGRVFLSGLLLAAGVLLLTAALGRVWCGWLCPLGSLLEWLGPRPDRRAGRRASGCHKQPPERWRSAKTLLMVVMLVAALFGTQALSFLDPVTIMNRSLATAIGPALRHAVFAAEAFLYRFDALWVPLDALHRSVVAPLFQGVQPVFEAGVPIALFLAGLVALNWWATRFWCRYLCPLGGLLALVSRRALLRREAAAGCAGCGQCASACPVGTIDPQKGFRSDPAECTVCLDCLPGCTPGSTRFRFRLPERRAAGAWEYDPSRRQVLLAAAAAAAGASLAGVEPVTRRTPARQIRPPGASTRAFDALCTRCGACVRACPTQGLQPCLLEAGFQGWMTPRLVPRLGYCDYGCTACGQVCPTGAIPGLPLDQKRRARIGLAAVDHNRCLPWAYGVACIVCEEACPVPDKAIQLEVVETTGAEGEPVLLQRPTVVQALCIGCGVCEFKCPMGGEAAIRVHAPTEAGL